MNYVPDLDLVRQLATKSALGHRDPIPGIRVVKEDKRCRDLGDADFDALTDAVDIMADTAKLTVRFGGEPLTLEQLRDELRFAWLRERENPARRVVAGYLAVAYDQLERACKAAAGVTTGATK